MARLLVTTGGGELEATVATYKAIITYATSSDPQIEYPTTSVAPSRARALLGSTLSDLIGLALHA